MIIRHKNKTIRWETVTVMYLYEDQIQVRFIANNHMDILQFDTEDQAKKAFNYISNTFYQTVNLVTEELK